MRSVTLDSNIFVSALVFGGEPWRVLKSAEDGLIRLDVSETIFEEFGRVLREKSEWSTEDVAKVQEKIRLFANLVTPTVAVRVVPYDAEDDPVVGCAAAARSDYLVTGDKHLLRLSTYGKTKIVKASEFRATARGR